MTSLTLRVENLAHNPTVHLRHLSIRTLQIARASSKGTPACKNTSSCHRCGATLAVGETLLQCFTVDGSNISCVRASEWHRGSRLLGFKKSHFRWSMAKCFSLVKSNAEGTTNLQRFQSNSHCADHLNPRLLVVVGTFLCEPHACDNILICASRLVDETWSWGVSRVPLQTNQTTPDTR